MALNEASYLCAMPQAVYPSEGQCWTKPPAVLWFPVRESGECGAQEESGPSALRHVKEGRLSMKFVLALCVLMPASVFAQADPCQPNPTVATITSGAPFGLTWLMDLTVPVSDMDPTPVANRIDGFSLQIDGGARQELGKLTPIGDVCSG